MSEKRDKQYVHIMNALALIHSENIILAKLILQTHLRREDADRIGKELEEDFNRNWNDIRTDW